MVVHAPNAAARMRLITFPYAGGGPSVFSAWPRSLPSDVELCAVLMPGRETRLLEAPIARWDGLIDQLIATVAPWMDRPTMFFGHSLGAIVAFELARQLPAGLRPLLLHLFVSGRRAPHVLLNEPTTYNLPEPEFVRELKRLAGTPEEVLQSPEMMEVYLPLLRADFALSETYAYQDGAPLTIPISAYGGDTDSHVSTDDVAAWRRYTIGAFRHVTLAGGHFFLNDNRSALLSQLTHELHAHIACLPVCR